MNNSKIRSAGAALEGTAMFKHCHKPHWTLQKTVAPEILADREIEKAREECARIKDEARRAFDKVNGRKPMGIFAASIEGGFKVLGFGVIVASHEDLWTIAKENNRTFVRVDGKDI